jgi:hypothetical protein
MLGKFIVELHIPTDGASQLELDNGPHGHCTLWGSVAFVRACIVSVIQF